MLTHRLAKQFTLGHRNPVFIVMNFKTIIKTVFTYFTVTKIYTVYMAVMLLFFLYKACLMDVKFHDNFMLNFRL